MRHRVARLTVSVVAALVLAGCGGSDQPEQQAQTRFNQADADFIPAMNQLLSQATTLGETAQRRSSNPQIKQLATSMKAAHDPQFERLVALMDEASKQPGLSQAHDHGESAHTIPGYLAQGDINRMSTVKGRAFDRMFLTLMTKHHQGAISATRDIQTKGSHQPTKDLARQIETSLTEHKEHLARLAG